MTDLVVRKKVTLRSRILGEKRAIQIITPADYETAVSSNPQLPVLYLLDGGHNCLHAAGTIDYLARAGRAPPMIIVAVGNTDRARDLTPSRSVLGLYGNRLRSFETTGGAEAFFSFLRDELIPWVEKTYRTAPFRMLHGHSFGGLFAIHVMMWHPEAFQAYVAVSPSLWWDNQRMLATAGPIGRRGQFLFVSVGNEGGNHLRSIERFAQQLRHRSRRGFHSSCRSFPAETHGSVPLPSLLQAMDFIFEGWDVLGIPYDNRRITLETGIQHCRKLSRKYGFRVVLSDVRCNAIANRLLFQGRTDAAIAAYRQALRLHPKSPLLFAGLAGALLQRGDRNGAARAFRRSLRLNPASETTRSALKTLSRSRRS